MIQFLSIFGDVMRVDIIQDAGFRVLPFHLALGQKVFLEHDFDRLEIKLRRQIHHGQVFIVETPVRVGGIAVALHQVLVKLHVAAQMPVEIHRHETAQLHKARINPPVRARIIKRHVGSHRLFKPFQRALFGKFGDGGF